MSKIDTNTTLAQVLKEHKDWLNSVDGTTNADLSFANLRSADLRSANLRSADLRSANLSSADLRSADLRFADLSFADLRSADLSFANLSSANLPKNCYVFQGSKHQLISINNMVRVGCEYHSVGVWLKKYKEIGTKAGYSKEEIKDYYDFIKFVAKRNK